MILGGYRDWHWRPTQSNRFNNARNVEILPATEVMVSLKTAASGHLRSSYLQLIHNLNLCVKWFTSNMYTAAGENKIKKNIYIYKKNTYSQYWNVRQHKHQHHNTSYILYLLLHLVPNSMSTALHYTHTCNRQISQYEYSLEKYTGMSILLYAENIKYLILCVQLHVCKSLITLCSH